MKFEEYLQIQKDFLKFIHKDKEINSYFLGAINSLSTASHELLPKSYKFQEKNISDYYKYSKLVDAFKYFLCIFNYYKLDIHKFDEFFNIISIYVKNRYILKDIIDQQDRYTRIALVDIDGVLAQFPEYFIKCFNKEYNTDYKYYDDIPVEIRNVYKEYYRASGMKAEIPLLYNAKEFLNVLKQMNYTIILFTNRPVYLYKNIAYDTTKWAVINNLQYDAILFAEDKMLDVIKKFNVNNIKLYVEDNISNANNINKLGIRTFLLKNKLNQKDLLKANKNLTLVDNLNDVIKEIKHD